MVVEDICDLLSQEPDGILPALGVGLVEEVVEGVHMLPALIILGFDNADDFLTQPLR